MAANGEGRLPKKTVEKMKYGENPREVPIAEISKPSYTLLPNKDLIELYSSHARFSNEKIKKTLGYEQRIHSVKPWTLLTHG